MNAKQGRRMPRFFSQLSIALLVMTSGAHAQTEVDPLADKSRDAVIAAMDEVATRIHVTVDDKSVERMKAPLFRFDDPARKHKNGSVWAWGTAGRPLTLVTIAQDGPQRWLAEATKCSVEPMTFNGIAMTGQFAFTDFPIETSFEGSETKIKLRMKAVARKLKAFELWDDAGKTEVRRFQLRLLPKAVYEYSDKKKEITTGQIYLVCKDTNPEVALFLEVGKDEKLKCGFGRMGWAGVDLQYEGTSFYTSPILKGGRGDDCYAPIILPVQQQPRSK